MAAGNGRPAGRIVGEKGFTLVEALIVVAIIGVMAMIAVPNFKRIAEAMRVEEETKRVYVDITGARSRAVITKRSAFVDFSAGANRVRTFEDTDPAPNGNGALSAAADHLLANNALTHSVDRAGLGGATTITFDPDGVTTANGFFRLLSPVNADYDCVRVEPTRIRLGKYDSTADACNAK